MNNTIKIDKTHIFNSIFRYIYITLFMISISLWVSVCILYCRQKPNNIDLIESEVTLIEFVEEENDYILELREFDHTFKVSNNYNDVLNLCEEVLIGDIIKVYYYKSTIKLDEVIAVKIEQDNNLIIDLEDNFKNDINSTVYVALIITIITVIILIIDIIISKRKYYKIYDYFEFYSKAYAVQRIYKDDLDSLVRTKKQKRAILEYIVLLVLLCVGIYICGIIFYDYPYIVIPIVVILMFLMIINLFKSYGHVLYREKNVELFVKKYITFLEGHTDDYIEYYFNEDEFLYVDINYEDEIDEEFEIERDLEYSKYSYEEMDFFAYCYFEKKFHSAHIYICSEKEISGTPFIAILTPKIYQDIKKNKVHIKGLDYLLSNLKEQIVINNRNKVRYKNYKNYK